MFPRLWLVAKTYPCVWLVFKYRFVRLRLFSYDARCVGNHNTGCMSARIFLCMYNKDTHGLNLLYSNDPSSSLPWQLPSAHRPDSNSYYWWEFCLVLFVSRGTWPTVSKSPSAATTLQTNYGYISIHLHISRLPYVTFPFPLHNKSHPQQKEHRSNMQIISSYAEQDNFMIPLPRLV